MKIVYNNRSDATYSTGTALAAGVETDLLPGSTAGKSLGTGNVIRIVLSETLSVLVDTITVYTSPTGGIFAPLSTTTSVASGSKRTITLRGISGFVRVTGNSSAGSANVKAEVAIFEDPSADQFQYIIDGVVQGQSTGGTITGNLAQSGGTAVINATGAVTIDASTSTTIAGTAGSLVLGRTAIIPSMPGGVTVAAAKALDTTSAGALNIGPTNATSIVVGKAGGTVAPSFPGGVTIGANKAVTGGTGSLTVDTTGALNLGTSAATSAVIGAATVAPSFPGGLTVGANKAVTGSGAMAVEATGALSLGVNASSTSIVVGQATVAPSFSGGVSIAADKAVTGAGAMAVEATGALSLGVNASSTSIVVGQATVAPSFTGGITIASAKAVTGAGNMAVESAAGSTLTLGAASNAMVIGQATKFATVNGDVDFQGAIKGKVADAGVAGASGTASAYFGTFTIASGGSTYTLTNTKILATSLLFCQCISGAIAQSVYSFIPAGGGGSAVLTLSGNAAANAKFAFWVVNPGA